MSLASLPKLVIRRSVAGPAVPLRQTPPTSFFHSTSQLLQPQSSPRSRFRIKNGHIFSVLTVAAIGATTYGLYDFYTSFTTFPKPVRAHLRAALRLATVDPARASLSFQEAYGLALAAALPLRQTSGIAIRWGSMWETAGNKTMARETYLMAWDEIKAHIQQLGAKVDEEDVRRGAALALRIGDLWVEDGDEQKAEKFYEWGLTELLRVGMSETQRGEVRKQLDKATADESSGTAPTSSEKELEKEGEPKWIGDVDTVGAMERLGQLYARMGNTAYAQPLLLQAIGTLLPPPAPKGLPQIAPPTIDARCHAATLMNNLSSTFVPPSGDKPSAENLDSASRWARQALTVANQNKKVEHPECEMTAAVAAYNLGKLSEIAGDEKSARAWFIKSGKQAAKIGFAEGLREARAALQSLGPASALPSETYP